MSRVPTEEGSIDVAIWLVNNDMGEKTQDIDKPTNLPNSHSALSNQTLFRKLLTSKRQLLVRMKRFCEKAYVCKIQTELDECLAQLVDIQATYTQYREAVDDVTDSELKTELVEQVEERFERCTKLCDNAKGRLSLYALEKDSKNIKSKCDREIFNVDTADSVSQVTGGMSVSSSKIAARQIELELKRAKLEANHKLALAQAQAQAQAESAQAQAVAAQALAQVEARHCIEKAELDAEERLIALSECGSMAASRKRGSVSSSQRVRGLLATVDRHLTINLDSETKRGILQAESGNVSPEFNNVILPGNNMGFNYHINQGMANNTLPLKQDVQPIHSLGATMQMQTPFNEQTPSSSTGEATLITYLER